MQKTQSDVSIDAIAFGFQSCFGEMASISFCLESAFVSGFRFGFGEMASISSRGGKARAFTYDYVKTRTEHATPHDLSASQSEAARSECVVLRRGAPPPARSTASHPCPTRQHQRCR
ncbi:MAG: hypothetical protein AB7V36_14475 [Bacteroidales bacterium]